MPQLLEQNVLKGASTANEELWIIDSQTRKALKIPNETPLHCGVQPQPRKGGACNPKQDGEPGKATRSSVYQEEKVSRNTWPTSVHEIQKETPSPADYYFP